MAVAKIHSVAFLGLNALPLEVEVDVAQSDQLSILVVGLPNTSVKESRDRVLAALRNCNFNMGPMRCTINLAPAHLKKEGTYYDLPIALGLLISLGKIPAHSNHQEFLIAGELGLAGELRPIRGALAITMLAQRLKKKGILLPAANAEEAAFVPHVQVFPIKHLSDAIRFFTSPSKDIAQTPLKTPTATTSKSSLDFSDINGQEYAKRAMEIAIAGGHNIVLSGPPGSGKTMLAKASIGIMPQLPVEEALETTKIHSIAGLLSEETNLITQPPFRSPHHTVSYAGLIGGGIIPRPGEVTLAHNGILFLDELPEFSRSVLEVLRQPLEDKKVTISRANGAITYPTKFICIAAMNPCPCGYRSHPEKRCKCTELEVQRYRSKISGPLWDRLDMLIEVPPLKYRDMIAQGTGETSATIRERVIQARAIQTRRFGKVKTNSEMTSQEIKQHARLCADCQELLRHAFDVSGISARVCERLTRVSRTIADLAREPVIKQEHLMEALAYRSLN